MINALKLVEQEATIFTMDFKNVTMQMEDTTGLIILMLLKMDVTLFVESSEDSRVCLEMKINETLAQKFVEME